MAATAKGPKVAPVSSSAVLTANTQPLPSFPVVYDSIASTVGFRSALPPRSAITSAATTGQLSASANAVQKGD